EAGEGQSRARLSEGRGCRARHGLHRSRGEIVEEKCGVDTAGRVRRSAGVPPDALVFQMHLQCCLILSIVYLDHERAVVSYVPRKQTSRGASEFHERFYAHAAYLRSQPSLFPLLVQRLNPAFGHGNASLAYSSLILPGGLTFFPCCPVTESPRSSRHFSASPCSRATIS